MEFKTDVRHAYIRRAPDIDTLLDTYSYLLDGPLDSVIGTTET